MDPFQWLKNLLSNPKFWKGVGTFLISCLVFVLLWLGVQAVLDMIFGGHIGWVNK